MRLLFLFGGTISFSLGFIGIFLPLLPTTPFILLAAYCFSKGSPQLHLWLLRSKPFGELIRNWENYGVIRPRAKALSVILLVGTLSYPLLFLNLGLVVKTSASLVAISVIAFILSRPSSRLESENGLSAKQKLF